MYENCYIVCHKTINFVEEKMSFLAKKLKVQNKNIHTARYKWFVRTTNIHAGT